MCGQLHWVANYTHIVDIEVNIDIITLLMHVIEHYEIAHMQTKAI